MMCKPRRNKPTRATRPLPLAAILAVCLLDTLTAAPNGAAEGGDVSGILFNEGFDDAKLLSRGWYDGDKFKISAKDAYVGEGCIEFHWMKRGTTPVSSSGIRRLFEPTEQVYLRYYIKLSPGWGWTNRPYHPHLTHFLTTENSKYHGPAASHLTLYVEPVNGRLRLAATDIQNKDAPHGLTQGPLRGGYNGRFYDSKEAVFDNTSWHCVEAMFKLNSLDMKNDKPNADGEVRGWFDGKLVVERTDVVFRSTDFPKMKFNQFLLTPYFGPGLLPRAQTLWIDELAVGTQRIRPVESKKTATGGEASGDRSSARRSQPDATASEKRRVGNWPQFRGPNRGNISPDIGLLRRWPPGGPPLVWKTTGLGSGFSSVSIVDGRIYTQGHIGGAELVFALDEATGRKLWTVTIGPAERVAYPGSRSTPTVDGDFLYLETVAGDVVCLDTRSTQVVWRRHLKEDFQGRPGCWGYAESPLVDGDRVVVTPGGEQAALVALDRRSGRVIWQASVPTNERDNWKHSRDPYADPAVAAYSSVIVTEVKGLRQYIQFMQQGVVGIRADGKFLWREDSSSCEYANCPTPIFHNSYVFSASGWQGAALIRLISEDSEVSTRLVYANNAMRNWYGGFFLHDGYVYGCSNEILMCMNFLTGEVAWKNRSVGMGSVVYADGHFIMRGDKGTVALVEATPDEYREKGRFDQPDRSDRPARTYPVVTGGRLYLRDEGVLLCYDVREGGR